MAHHRLASPPKETGLHRSVGRRKFLGYLIAAPTLVVAAELGREQIFGAPEASAAALPSAPQTPESTTSSTPA